MAVLWHKVYYGILFVFVVAPLVRGSTDHCPQWMSVNISDAVVFRNGTLRDLDSGVLYPPSTFWTEARDGRAHFHGCPCLLDKPCLRKCCPKNEAMDNVTLVCIPHEEREDWFLPRVGSDPTYNERVAEHGEFLYSYGNYCYGFLLEPNYYPADNFYLNFTDGTLTAPEHNKTSVNSSEFCLEYFPAVDVYLPYVCFKPIGSETAPDTCDNLRYLLYPMGMSISIVFLIISLLIYSTTPELRNLHGKCLMCHIMSLLVAYLFLAIVQVFGRNLNEDACTSFGFVIYFAMLCSFFWLNIMCIDIYITFSSFMIPRGNFNSNEKKKFLWYVLYAWGVPLVIASITAAMESLPEAPQKYLRPTFKYTCWFHSDTSKLAYFIAPVGVIVLCNVLLFIKTAYNIHKVTRETSILKRGESSNNREDRNRMKLYIKLSIVMGVSWMLEIISFFIGGSNCIWLFTDVVNTLQGLFIFLIFVCKKNIKELMKKRLQRLLAKLIPRITAYIVNDKEEDQGVETSTSKTGGTASTELPCMLYQAKIVEQQKEP